MSEDNSAAPKHPGGRPSEFDPAIAATICDRIAGGESLRAICEEEAMPSRAGVLKWLASGNHPQFVDQYARAREMAADSDADDIAHYAREAAAGSIEPAAATAAINGLKWSAGKRQPKKYGEAVQMRHSGGIGVFDPTKLTDDQLAQLEHILGPVAAGAGDAAPGAGGEGPEGG